VSDDPGSIDWRLRRVEQMVDNGRFIRRETYEADQRAQEKTDLAQEQRIAELREGLTADINQLRSDLDSDIGRLDAKVDAGLAEGREDRQWLRRALIQMLLTVLVTATIAALALRAAA